MSSSPVTKRCYARIGLLGNPSDGYNGATISLSLANFYAEVTLTTAANEGQVSFIRHPVHDADTYKSLGDLSSRLDSYGYGSGVDLLKAACYVFHKHCKKAGAVLKTPGGFSLSYETTIPRQTGLAGSSAIVTAAIRCLMEWYGVSEQLLPKEDLPGIVLEAEKQLGITAGLQDRVIQAYGGLVYMDFSQMPLTGRGTYHPMDPGLLPKLFLIWRPEYASHSGKVHSRVRQRWDAGAPEVMEGMRQLAACAQQGRQALEARDTQLIAQLMRKNFQLRCSLFGNEVVGQHNLHMVQVCHSVGAAAKLPGSGGAVVALCPDGLKQEQALLHACQEQGLNVEEVVVAPPN